MIVSIITVCLNSEKTIESTIKSVLDQTYSHIEYIIIDGRSTDKTMKIVEKYKDRIAIVLSEKDTGIYEAMNKGVMMAKGEVVSFLNSDDFYSHKFVVEKVVNILKQEKRDAVYGDLLFIPQNDDLRNNSVKIWQPKGYSKRKVLFGWHFPHPTFFVKKSYFTNFGNFDMQFKIASDYDLMTRFLLKGNLSPSYIPEVLVKMRLGGVSNQMKNKAQAWHEVFRIFKKNGMSMRFALLITRWLIFHFHLRSVSNKESMRAL